MDCNLGKDNVLLLFASQIPSKLKINKTKATKKLPYEDIDYSIYKPEALCVAFKIAKLRILAWIWAVHQNLRDKIDKSPLLDLECKLLADNGEEVPISDLSKPNQIMKIQYQLSKEAEPNSSELLTSEKTLLYTIHIFVRQGFIMIQGKSYQQWADDEFPKTRKDAQECVEYLKLRKQKGLSMINHQMLN